MNKFAVLFVITWFLATFTLIGCNKSQEPQEPAAGPASEAGAPEGYETPAPLPPPLPAETPPDVVALPDTDDVYAAPEVNADLYFWDGWWWRLWEGGWHRSHYYNRNWGYYNNVPSFYFDVDPGWRGYYREHNWHGHRWNYERIPDQQLERNWQGWHNERHWEKQGTWGVQGYQPPSPQQRQALRQQRQRQYQSEIERIQPQRQPQAQRPEVQRPQQQRQPQAQKPQLPQKKPEGKEPEHEK